MCPVILEGKLLKCSFIEKISKNEAYEKYFLPVVIEEINNKENC